MVYRFNGKELDEETGLAYYGARYYDNQLSVWLSVDPLAMKGKNMSLTPYHFVSNNPIMRVDPDGMWDWLLGESGTFTKSEENTLYPRNADGDVRSINSMDDLQKGEELVDKIIAEDDPESIVYVESAGLNRTKTANATVRYEDGTTEQRQAEYRLFENVVDAENLFIFAANHTSKEWAFAEKLGEGMGAMVGTTGDDDHIWLPDWWEQRFDLYFSAHTHNSGRGPSGPDLDQAEDNPDGPSYRAVYDIPSRTYLGYSAQTKMNKEMFKRGHDWESSSSYKQ